MTDTTRTTVTLEQSYMDLVEKLVGVYGATKAQVISRIVQHFFDNSQNFALINDLKIRKRNLDLSKDDIVKEKIKNYLKIYPKGRTIDEFKEDISKSFKIEPEYIIDHLIEWIEKFNLKQEDGIISL